MSSPESPQSLDDEWAHTQVVETASGTHFLDPARTRGGSSRISTK